MNHNEEDTEGVFGGIDRERGGNTQTETDAECDLCGAVADASELTETTLLDSSGGSIVVACGPCLERIGTDRCSICGDRKTGRHKSDAILVHDTGDEDGEENEERARIPVCDGCRLTVLTGTEAVR
jgi:hypothetical protein